jgi:hypothetical protein
MEIYIERLGDIGTWMIEAGTEAYHWKHNWERVFRWIDVESDVYGGTSIDDRMDGG